MVNELSEDSENTNNSVKQKSLKKMDIKKVIVGLLIVALLVLNVLQWRQFQQFKSTDKQHRADYEYSKQKVADLEKQLAEEKANSVTPVVSNSVTPPSSSTIENIKASISSGNTAALEGYMTPSVKVIIAASEGIGDRTPAQAVKDLDYVKDGTDPWNFALPTSTLNQYAGGFYGQYFPTSAVVGKSANKYVISFTFNNSGKISGIFMCVNSDLL